MVFAVGATICSRNSWSRSTSKWYVTNDAGKSTDGTHFKERCENCSFPHRHHSAWWSSKHRVTELEGEEEQHCSIVMPKWTSPVVVKETPVPSWGAPGGLIWETGCFAWVFELKIFQEKISGWSWRGIKRTAWVTMWLPFRSLQTPFRRASSLLHLNMASWAKTDSPILSDSGIDIRLRDFWL